MQMGGIHNDTDKNSGSATDDNGNQEYLRSSSSQISVSVDNCSNDRMRGIGMQHGSIDIMNSWRRHSLSFSRRGSVPQFLDDDTESEVVSQAGDIGDRELNSNRYSESGRLRLSVDNMTSVENEVVPIPEEPQLQMYGFWSQNTNVLNTTSPVSPLPSEIVSPLSTDGILSSRDKAQSGTVLAPSQPIKVNQKELPQSLEYISCLIHLAVFGILGVLTRYLLEKLFGPTIAGVTSNQSALYLDLPSNVVGSFLMGWLGVVFKEDICHVSDFLAIGLTTGYLGSLTTFSGWNQKMLDLSVDGQWVASVVGILLGLCIVADSIRAGVETAKGVKWLFKRYGTSLESGTPSSRNNCMVDSFRRHLVVLVVMLLMLGLLWGVSGVLVRRQFDEGTTSAELWLACIVGPPGVWIRWFLARLNGRGLGRKGLMKWIPFGTLFANVSAACVMAALSTLKKVVKTKRCEIIATGIQFGLLGCLSTVSTFIAEFHAMRQSKHPWRAYAYATITILPSFILGTLIYSVPVWSKRYQ